MVKYPPFGAKICSDICPRTLSVPGSEQFSESVAREKLRALGGTDNAQGQISQHIFEPCGRYCLYICSHKKADISPYYKSMLAILKHERHVNMTHKHD